MCFVCTTRCTQIWSLIHACFRCETWSVYVLHMKSDSFMFSPLICCVYDTMHSEMKHDSFIFQTSDVIHSCFTHGTWFIYVFTFNVLRVRHDALRYETWFIHVSGITRDSFMFSHLTICVHDTIQSDMKRDSFMFKIWNMIHSCFRYQTWFIHVFASVLLSVRHDALRYETWFSQTWDLKRDSFMFYIWDAMHSYVRHDSCMFQMWNVLRSTTLGWNDPHLICCSIWETARKVCRYATWFTSHML